MIQPSALSKKLSKNAKIGVFSPSGFIQDDSFLHKALNNLSSLGFETITSKNVQSKWKYYAGTDKDRLSDFHDLLKNPEIDLIMASRGGYGWTRLLKKLDYQLIQKSGKILIGFSDFTLLNLSVLAKNNQITFHGPMATADFRHETISEFTLNHFLKLLQSDSHSISNISCNHPYKNQIIEGSIWGGCLSLFVHLIGTPYFPKIEGGILFIEDVNEQPYHIERMLFQLYHSGLLENQSAILFGQFNDCIPTEKSASDYLMDDVLESLRNLIDIPVLTNFPFGHVKDKITIPYGAKTKLSLQSGSYSLKFSEYHL